MLEKVHILIYYKEYRKKLQLLNPKGKATDMHYLVKTIVTFLIPLIMHTGVFSLVSVTPHEAAYDFLEGLKTQETQVMDKYMDNAYINFLNNVQGDEEVIARMNDALFSSFSYKIEKVKEKEDVAVARVVVTSVDFSGVMDAYDKASYKYVMDNLYTEGIEDKEALNAKCLEIYVKQIEKAAESGETVETVVFVPMVDDGYYGWNIIMTDELMKSVMGNLQVPAL